MQDNFNYWPPGSKAALSTFIQGIKFTYRELEIIACLLNGRSPKTIASLLSISPRTIETHIANIMRKIGYHSREGVIDFIEKSGNASWMRRHYRHLLIQADFKKRLEEISCLMRHRALVCRIVYDHQQEDQKSIIHRIEKHLTLSGIKTVLDKRDSTPPLTDLMNENSHNKEYLLYVLSRELIDLFQADKKKQKSALSHLLQEVFQNPDSTFLWLDHNILEIPQEFLEKGCVDFRDQENYDVSIFKILKRILPDIPLDPIISEFKKQKESIHGSSGKRFSPDTLSPEDLKQKKTLFVYIMEHVLKYRRWW